jgi:hypothetical protein
MMDYSIILSALGYMALTLGFIVIVYFVLIALNKAEKAVTQRRQHRDTLQEIRRLKADQAYACLNDMNEYYRMELKHGQHGEAYNDALDKSWEHFHQVLSENGVHIDEEYR